MKKWEIGINEELYLSKLKHRCSSLLKQGLEDGGAVPPDKGRHARDVLKEAVSEHLSIKYCPRAKPDIW